MKQDNPLLDNSKLPLWSQIKPEHITPALDVVLQENRDWLQQALTVDTRFTWNNLVAPLNEASNWLERTWSPVSHLNAVVNTDELRKEYNSNLPRLSDYHTEMGQNAALYAAIRSIRAQDDTLDSAQQKSLDDSLLGFKLSGVALPEAQKERFREISQQLSQLNSRFSDNVLDATNAWVKQITDVTELAGLPESALEMAAQTAKQRDMQGWVLTLQFPSYFPVLTYADNRALRAEMYRAYTTRASELGANPDWDNTAVMRDILRLRQEEAALLGYANYAELSLATKMAESPQQVLEFLADLAHKAKPFAEQEFAEVGEFARTLGIDEVEAWDVAYVSEKMKQARFDFSEEDLKPYFSADRVISGLFTLVEKLFGVRIEQQQAHIDLWHSDVRFYLVYDRTGTVQACFYLDLYARQHKRGGAWMSDFCGRFRRQDGLQIPVAFMTCNGSPPVGDKPALFTHDEVVTLFHEFGHGLHHMLTQVDYPDIAGINGVEWDAVELPSQFMENWCWERSVLDMIAAHWQTGEPLPENLYQKMQAARHFQTAMATVRQLEFALFDMRLHLDPQAAEPGRLEAIRAEVQQQVAVIKPPVFNRMPHSFTHVFAGGYAAGYYSYKWAEVLSADAFARFEEEGLFNAGVGEAFLNEVLAVGGSRKAMESFVAFRGRKPSVDALLRHNGLAV
ncbi:MAG TPA: M3 family metallopeptidase [Candidatus Thiothrix moscowensis]|uniref:M3 family metallopeptidase n=1 Tax=unclassified Thiothrix TaxID=2636184 RepID=UPI0025E24922|nr:MULTISPECIES: M3 family metallopeptidase [unclassified Thiothrix]HRJ51920.1 M3 family metallopeptidase [Candidatus Thiothrix moscowensis]HRJ92235.1 M3 family metallopeptidase [Candidatus Thiothrix moscowensis]